MTVAAVLVLTVGAAWALRDRGLSTWSARSQPAVAEATLATPDRTTTAEPERERPPTPATFDATLPAANEPAMATTTEPAAPATTAGAVDARLDSTSKAPPAGATTPRRLDPLARPPGVSSADSQREAYAAVFERWNASIAPSDVPCNEAPQAGLQCLKLNGTLQDIERLDHPAVIELWDDRAEPYYAAILAHHDGRVTARLGGRSIDVGADELSGHWYGSYIVLWQMPPDYRGNLKIGDEGPPVAWLRQHLANTLHIDLRAPNPARFDDALQAALIRFQRENGMVPDGVAGPMTWIAMNSDSTDPMPRLSDGG